MPPSAKGTLELGFGLLQIGVRLAKARIRQARRPSVHFGAVEAEAVTTAGVLELVRTPPERHAAGRGHIGPHYRYSVEVDTVPVGFVIALLDHGTASATIVSTIDTDDYDVVAPEAVGALVDSIRHSDPWLRRASIAVHPDDIGLSRALRLRGFACEGDVPGYVDDVMGTRRHLWTAMLD
ncbi:hypothetical protein DK926_04295 [Rhodococcus sp. Eu-32]|uniref:hypothetical protein n=1 Tax=Rhodococcus sp. Eu-32 TaxID=1017319 RepID=UPI000DF2698E|nr:hypothetical protein [Rhodococcus sp. Eu-32]RRQ29118.1 hypothetical protein DK926_04295 [Rhodococcus sp. Eu-32]